MERILNESGFEGDIERTVGSLAQSLDSMTNEQYMRAIASAFSGKGDMGGVENFINTDFQMPDLSENKSVIFEGVTKYLNENLGFLEMDEENIASIVSAVQDELTQPSGPNFYALPFLFEQAGLDKEQ
jgi:hypothetical protein